MDTGLIIYSPIIVKIKFDFNTPAVLELDSDNNVSESRGAKGRSVLMEASVVGVAADGRSFLYVKSLRRKLFSKVKRGISAKKLFLSGMPERFECG